MSNVVIKQAGLNEIDAVKSLSLQNNSDKTHAYWERCEEAVMHEEVTILLANAGEEAAGYCLLNWRPKYKIYQHQDIPEIQDLNVLRSFRGQGIGRAMIEQCEELARQKNKEAIGISFALGGSYGPAQRLYLDMGYRPDGFGVTYDREQVPFGQLRPVDDDLCLMLVKNLSPES